MNAVKDKVVASGQKKSTIDWFTDKSFPKIKRHDSDDEEGGEPMTFREAKREIVEKLQNEISSLKAFLGKYRKMKLQDVE